MTKQDVILGLRALGVGSGDMLLVRADMGAIGRLESRDRMEYLAAFLEAVGPGGTVMGLAFTASSFLKLDRSQVFDPTTKAYTGAFANLMLQHPEALRSTHPTNSFVAIGAAAGRLLEGHDENAGAYEPVRKLVELGGKMLLVGCANTSPGFTTTHLAEIDLGYHRKIIAPWLSTAYYLKNGRIHLFRRRDPGSCSNSFYRFYAHYVNREALVQGRVGKAYSLAMDARTAYEIDRDVLVRHPRVTICDNPDCLTCRARRWDNLHHLPLFVLRRAFRAVHSRLRR